MTSSIRIHRVSIAAFRGVRTQLELDLSAPLTLIYAPNGTAKTTICDAVEWLLTGEIERLGGRGADQDGGPVRCKFSPEDTDTVVDAEVSVGEAHRRLVRGFNSLQLGDAEGGLSRQRPGQLLEWLAPTGAEESASALAAISSRRNWLRGTRFLSSETLALLIDSDPDTVAKREQVFADLLGVGSLLDTEKAARTFGSEIAPRIREIRRRAREIESQLQTFQEAEEDASHAFERALERLSRVSSLVNIEGELELAETMSLEELADATRDCEARLAGDREAQSQKRSAEDVVVRVWPELSQLHAGLEKDHATRAREQGALEPAETERDKARGSLQHIETARRASRDMLERLQLSIGDIAADGFEPLLDQLGLLGETIEIPLRQALEDVPETQLEEQPAEILLRSARDVRDRTEQALGRRLEMTNVQRQLQELEPTLPTPDALSEQDERLRRAIAELGDVKQAHLSVAGPIEQLRAATSHVLGHIGDVTDCPACGHDWESPGELRNRLAAVSEGTSAALKELEARVQSAQRTVTELTQLARTARANLQQAQKLREVKARAEELWGAFVRDLARLGVSPDAEDVAEEVEKACNRIEFARVLRILAKRADEARVLVPGADFTDETVRQVPRRVIQRLQTRSDSLSEEIAQTDQRVTAARAVLTAQEETVAGIKTRLAAVGARIAEKSPALERFKEAWARIGGVIPWQQNDLDRIRDVLRREGEKIDEAATLIESIKVELARSIQSRQTATLRTDLAERKSALARLEEQSDLAERLGEVYREKREEFERSQVRDLERVVSSMFGRMQANRVFDGIATGRGEDSTVRWSAVADNMVLHPETHFSTGQRQDLALALFLARARSLGGTFFLDEPVAHLDDLNRVAVLDTLRMIIAERRPSMNLVVTTANRSLLRHMAEKFGRFGRDSDGNRALRVIELEGTPRTSVAITAINEYGL